MKKIFLTLSLTLTIFVGGLMMPALSYAQNAKQDICNGITANAGSNGDCTAPGPTVSDIIADVVNLLSAVVGIVAVIMIILGGFRYVTAAGDSSKISGAKDTILYALIGLVVASFAQLLVWFVLKKTGIS